jgi:flagellar motor switch protein FliM
MTDILSQNEIDALLSALSSGEVSAEKLEEEEVRSVKVYDFRHPDRFSKDQTRALQMLHDHFARLLATSMSTFLRTIAEVRLVSVDQLSYNEFIRSIANPTCISLLKMNPLDGNGLVDISPGLSFTIVDRLLGGVGKDIKKNRELTEIEQTLLKKVVEGVCESLREAWRNVVPLEPELETMETNPQLFLQYYLPTEMVILLTFEVTIGDSSGATSFCIPYPTIEPIAQNLSSRSWFSASRKSMGDKSRKVLQSKLNSVDLELMVSLGKTQLTVRDILEMRVGDVIPLRTKVDSDVPVYVGGHQRYRGKPGAKRKQRAVRIVAVNELMEA